MPRFDPWGDDENRLPDGMELTGYDADTGQRYYVDRNDGSRWEGAPHATYGVLTRIGGPTKPSKTSHHVRNPERQHKESKHRRRATLPIAPKSTETPKLGERALHRNATTGTDPIKTQSSTHHRSQSQSYSTRMRKEDETGMPKGETKDIKSDEKEGATPLPKIDENKTEMRGNGTAKKQSSRTGEELKLKASHPPTTRSRVGGHHRSRSEAHHDRPVRREGSQRDKTKGEVDGREDMDEKVRTPSSVREKKIGAPTDLVAQGKEAQHRRHQRRHTIDIPRIVEKAPTPPPKDTKDKILDPKTDRENKMVRMTRLTNKVKALFGFGKQDSLRKKEA